MESIVPKQIKQKEPHRKINAVLSVQSLFNRVISFQSSFFVFLAFNPDGEGWGGR